MGGGRRKEKGLCQELQRGFGVTAHRDPWASNFFSSDHSQTMCQVMPFLGIQMGKVSKRSLSCRGRVGVVADEVSGGVEA